LYGAQKAVDSISFQVKTGEILGFLGPNGAGKTTTMKILTCFMAPNGGDVKVGEYSIHDHQEIIKSKIGYLPENNPLYYEMPVLEYLEFTANLQGVPKENMENRIGEMVQVCGLNAEKHKNIGELSKGYRQRVGLAQAMIHNPEILIFDEPTSGLDPNQIIEIRNLIKRIGRQKTVILSTHILPEVEAICDRILIINKGKIVADGTPDTLRKQAQGEEMLRIKIEDETNKDLISSTLRSIESIAVVDPVADSLNTFMVQSRPGTSSKRAVFQMCVQKNWTLTELTPIETKLEDIFRELTT
ncbi:MAG TPA: ATP-binding cassette domain-containing protein, partial [Ignavibacteriaceae bacterium]|nr:ATP-binding cassette domain-containing protein [Ignavibacteriaceae bacterium]